MTDDLSHLDATAQGDLVRTGQATPADLVEAAIARIEARNPTCHAVIHERFDRALDEARGDLPHGPFRGVPIVVKDLDGFLAGEPYHAGTRILAEVGYRAPADSYVITKLRQAGLVVVGKTNTPELGLLPTTEPVAQGPTRNPWDPTRSAGGSSGGSAAAVASGMVPLGHAGDGGGSIRIPSSACGLVGLKPSRGRHSFGPEAGESWGGLVARMVLTRTVRDAAAMLQIIQGAMPGDPYSAPAPACPFPAEVGVPPGRLRIGLTVRPPGGSGDVDPQCVAATQAAGALLASLGHEVEEAAPAPWADPEAANALVGHFLTAYCAWTAASVDQVAALAGRPVEPGDVEPLTWALAASGREVAAVDYLAAIEHFHAYTRQVASFWVAPEDGGDGFDLLLTPTLAELPPPLGTFDATPENPLAGLFRSASLVPFVTPFNITGQPAVSLPLGQSREGLPIGVQLVGAFSREDLLLRVAAQLESAAPWADRFI